MLINEYVGIGLSYSTENITKDIFFKPGIYRSDMSYIRETDVVGEWKWVTAHFTGRRWPCYGMISKVLLGAFVSWIT